MFDEAPKKELIDVYKYTCSGCTYSFYTTSNRSLGNCVICGGNNLKMTKSQESGEFYYLPFLKTLDYAKTEYKKRVAFNPLIPIVFKKKSTINSISKIYIPALLVNANIKGGIDFLGADRANVVRNGEKLIETCKYEVSATVNFDYNKLALSTCSLIHDKFFNNIGTYNYSNLRKVTKNSFDDSCCLNVNLDITDIGNKNRDYITKRSLKLVRDHISHQLKKTVNNKTNIVFNNSIQVLLPVYYLRLSYKGKSYVYLMNGDSGEINFETTIGRVELFIFSLIVFAFIFGIGFLIAYFL